MTDTPDPAASPAPDPNEPVSIVLEARLYLPPGHAPHEPGAVLTVRRSVADGLIAARHARLAAPEPAPPEPAPA